MERGRVLISGSRGTIPPEAEQIRRSNPNETETISVVLRRRGSAPPSTATIAQPLDRQAFSDTYGADPSDIEKVRKFASEHGLTVVQADLDRRTVTLSGTLGALSKAFAVDLHSFDLAGASYRANLEDISIPVELNGIVEGVLGLDNSPAARPR